MKFILNLTLLASLSFLFSCNGNERKPDEEEGDDTTTQAVVSNPFNMDSAYAYVQKQVDFGPRVPNTEAHNQCAEWLKAMLQKWSDTVYVQNFTAKNYKGEEWRGVNLIGTFNPQNRERLLLCAHWDTRPWADQDTKNPNTPSDGASDGASGVGVLLEIARQLHLKKPALGIDILFFDLEDGGDNEGEVSNSWCLGSQYWARHLHVPDYRAKNGILLDMVGGRNALFAREAMSIRFDNNFLGEVWNTAASINFGNYFINYTKAGITDDHVYVSYEAKVPTIDIIEYNPNTTSGFGKYWHTHDDNMSVIDKNTLNAVGKTVLQVVLKRDAVPTP